jgi:HEAT repeat protein
MLLIIEKKAALSPERIILSLLAGQMFCLALAFSLLNVAAYTSFLVDYGADYLPYVYIAIAILVSTVSYGFIELQKNWSLSKLTMTAFIVFAGLFFLTPLGLSLFQAQWLSFGLMVSVTLVELLGFILVGMQAGRLFTVRQMKRLYPLILTGLIVGYMVGGLAVSPLLQLLGTPENLLLISGGSTLVALIFLLVTNHRFQAELGQAETGNDTRPTKSAWQLLKKRFVTLIFSYQMLSAVGTQLVIFIYFTQAETRYPIAEDLAQFFGNITVVREVTTLMFTGLVAGRLLNRFGLGFGLAANPAGVGLAVLAMAVIAGILGLRYDGLFWIAIGAYILDVIFTDGTTSTSIKSSYQALPTEEQSVVETAVEGIGVPIAFGITGLILLGINAINLSPIYIIFFTLLVTIFWTAAALFVYRDYAGTLMQTLSRRALSGVELLLGDRSSLSVVETLLKSANRGELQLALDLLEQAEHKTLGPSLITLADHPQSEIRAEALNRIARLQVQTALPVVNQRLAAETDPTAKGAALRALCALTEAEAVELLPDEYLDDPEPEIRLGAMAGLLRYGGISGVLTAGLPLTFLVDDIEPEQRAFAAQVIGEVGMNSFYQPLLPLLADEDVQVRLAALTAAGQVKHARLLPLVIDSLGEAATRAEAMLALIACGEVALPIVAQALAGETRYDQETIRRLVRVCGRIKGNRVIDLLKPHLDYPNADVHYQILFALNLCGYRTSDDEQLEQALRNLVEYGTRVLLAKQDLGEADGLAPLQAALASEFSQARHRIFLLLSFIYEAQAMLRAAEQLDRGSKPAQALAIETLDVTLSSEHRALILPLVEESLSLSQRTGPLVQVFSLARLGREQRLKEMITDTQVWTQDWTRACAIYASGKLVLKELAEAVANALSLADASVRETAVWALHKTSPEQYQQHVAEFVDDPNPQVAQLVSQLAVKSL